MNDGEPLDPVRRDSIKKDRIGSKIKKNQYGGSIKNRNDFDIQFPPSDEDIVNDNIRKIVDPNTMSYIRNMSNTSAYINNTQLPRLTSPMANYVIGKQMNQEDDLKLKTIRIQDNRPIDPTKRLNYRVNPQTINNLIGVANKVGEDPNTTIARGLQETGLNNINPLHDNNINSTIFKKIQDSGY